MTLKSNNMHRHSEEKHWLKWWGPVGKIRMRWSYLLNRHRVADVEKTFEGIVQTRKKLLIQWAEQQWAYIESLARIIEKDWPNLSNESLINTCSLQKEISEIFIISPTGNVLYSSFPPHQYAADLPSQASALGLKQNFLHGPYADPLTKQIGATCSSFHDDMTLMFYRPLKLNGETLGSLCARIPNDVMSDLIQREAGHVYPDSGDNYLFMVESKFDPSIQSGVALSRSRFEDSTFTHGDNLKQGVRTDYGSVSVKHRTELELRFTDPATRQLHPGVRETIGKQQHVFVCYPGYPDYRHIPVIGAGLTLKLPGSLDTWGLLCEGDLEEVYRQRSVDLSLLAKLTLLSGAGLVVVELLKQFVFPEKQLPFPVTLSVVFCILYLFWLSALRPHRLRLQRLTNYFQEIAESGRSLQSRIDVASFPKDETSQLARWINSFVDKLDETVTQVLTTASALSSASSTLQLSSNIVNQSSLEQRSVAESTVKTIQEINSNIIAVADNSTETVKASHDAHQISARGGEVVALAAKEMADVAQSVRESSSIIRILGECADEIDGISNTIKDIAEQTNLLALNAAIEAARAGEQGRGFAVVADEVRNLSVRTAQATHEIARTISTIQHETAKAIRAMETSDTLAQKGVLRADEASAALKQIHTGALSTLERVQTVTQSVIAQKTLAGQVNNQVLSMEQNAHNSHQAVRETLNTIQTLSQLVLTLQSVANKFKV